MTDDLQESESVVENGSPRSTIAVDHLDQDCSHEAGVADSTMLLYQDHQVDHVRADSPKTSGRSAESECEMRFRLARVKQHVD